MGDGAVWCSIDDMIHWVRGLSEHKGLSPAAWTKATQPTRLNNGKINNYGFGLVLTHNRDGSLAEFGHEGSWGGFLTAFNHNAALDRTIIVLSNRGDLDIEQFVETFTRELEAGAASKEP